MLHTAKSSETLSFQRSLLQVRLSRKLFNKGGQGWVKNKKPVWNLFGDCAPSSDFYPSNFLRATGAVRTSNSEPVQASTKHTNSISHSTQIKH